MSKKLQIWIIILIMCFLLLIQFIFFNISISHSNRTTLELDSKLKCEINKLDSLESVINMRFINKKDTIIINNYPQTIKIYK